MMGRREMQRQKRRTAMLRAASRLFDKQGYARTTFEEIADSSGVGVATVYKYFSSKQGLVTALLEPDLQRILASAQKVIDRLPTDPAKSMAALLSCYGDLGGHHWASRELLQFTVFPGLGNEGLLTEFVRRAESETMRQIAELLRRQKAAGRLRASLPVDDATAVIFALLNQHFGTYLFDPDLSYASMFRRLSRRVQLVFTSWRA